MFCRYLEPISDYIATLDHFKSSRLFDIIITASIRAVQRGHGDGKDSKDSKESSDGKEAKHGSIQMETFVEALARTEGELRKFCDPTALTLGEASFMVASLFVLFLIQGALEGLVHDASLDLDKEFDLVVNFAKFTEDQPEAKGKRKALLVLE